MKGQISAVSIVMISGVVMSLMGAAYFWGVPLIDKQSSGVVFETASTFVLTLNKKIISVANAGGGEDSMEIPSGNIIVDADSDSIVYEVIISQPLALNNSEVYLGGATFNDVLNSTGTFGEASPSIITFKMEPLGTQYKGIFNITFRPLEDPPNTYKITLSSIGSQTGTSRINWRFDKTVEVGMVRSSQLEVEAN